MNGIGWAVIQLQNGNKVRRAGWNSFHEVIYVNLITNLPKALPCLVAVKYNGKVVLDWLPSERDLFAIDWEIYDV